VSVERHTFPLLPRGDLPRALRDDPSFRAGLAVILRGSAFAGYFLELPVIAPSTRHLPAELVLVESASVAGIRANSAPFANLFGANPADILVNPSLGGDSTLVIPRPEPGVDCGHLARFARTARPERLDALLKTWGDACLSWGERPLWLSTSGLGVYWLHLRLDPRPKYYAHAPYRDARP
jgi:hypothetical protein